MLFSNMNSITTSRGKHFMKHLGLLLAWLVIVGLLIYVRARKSARQFPRDWDRKAELRGVFGEIPRNGFNPQRM